MGPLIGSDGTPAFEEDTWSGHHLRLGDTGATDVHVLKAIADVRGVQPSEMGERGVNPGVYGTVVTPGTVRLGDELALV